MMETMTFFKILLALLLVGTFISLFTGVALPGSPGSSQPIGDLNISLSQMTQDPTEVCYKDWYFCVDPGCSYTCYPTAAPSWFGIPAFVGWVISSIISGITFGIQCLTFFTGLGALLIAGSFTNGIITITIPPVIAFIMLIIVSFAWIFIALEVVGRVIGVIWGR